MGHNSANHEDHFKINVFGHDFYLVWSNYLVTYSFFHSPFLPPSFSPSFSLSAVFFFRNYPIFVHKSSFSLTGY